MKKNSFLPCLFCAASLFIAGCSSVPKEIPEDLDARQLIQLGQDNYDLHRYKAAEIYFNEVLKRFGDDPKHYIEAKYELGHLYLKQKRYSAAYHNFTEIQEIYQNVPAGLPGSYKILCGIELAKIPQGKIEAFEAKAKAEEEELQAELERRQKEEAEQAAKEREAAALEQRQRASAEESFSEKEEKPQEAESQKQEEESEQAQ